MPRRTPFEKTMHEMLFGKKEKPKRKRVRLTPKQRIYIWEHPKQYGRMCSICHKRIAKLSDLELDHTKPYSKGGTKLSLAHRDCNRMKSSGSLRKIQKALGIKTTKKKTSKAKRRKKKPTKRKRPKTPLERLTKQLEKDF